jgi:hypothetical protein
MAQYARNSIAHHNIRDALQMLHHQRAIRRTFGNARALPSANRSCEVSIAAARRAIRATVALSLLS